MLETTNCLEPVNIFKHIETRKKTSKKQYKKSTKKPANLKKYREKKGYRLYLKTPHWIKFRSEYHKGKEKKCFCCNGKTNDLHHINYNNLFNETDKDVITVCRKCHNEIHRLIKKEGLTLDNAHTYLRDCLLQGYEIDIFSGIKNIKLPPVPVKEKKYPRVKKKKTKKKKKKKKKNNNTQAKTPLVDEYLRRKRLLLDKV